MPPGGSDSRVNNHHLTDIPPPPSPPSAADGPAPTEPPQLIINPDLPPEEADFIRARLLALSHTFASTSRTEPPAIAPGVEHTIHLSDYHPIKQKAYRQSPEKQAVVSKAIANLLKGGVIVPSNSPWASPVTLAVKSIDPVTGKIAWRFCIDYRRLNARTRKDAYPVPIIEDLLGACKDADWMSTVDIKDAFYHIVVATASRALTAFVTPDGLFEWNRMTFGLANAPATFLRYVNQVLLEFIGKFCVIFFDDGLVYTKGTLAQHMDHVAQVLTALHAAGLEASTTKCRFGYQELLFVGHVVGHGTIRPDPDKIKAITEYPRPTTVTQVKAFLGLANYYRRFVDGFAVIAQPLYQLLKKGVALEWTQPR